MPYRSRCTSHAKKIAAMPTRKNATRVGAISLASATALASLSILAAGPAVAATAPSTQQPSTTTVHLPAQVHARGKARVTAAVLPLDGGSRKVTLYGDDRTYDTASIVKVDILAAVLLRAQDAGRPLTTQERAYAQPMIRHSDNAAANALWRQIGRAPGLDAANKRLGLTATKGGPGNKWGLTRTTASDQIRLLGAVFDGGATSNTASAALNNESRAYVRALMSSVTRDQAWGVSAAGGSALALKNGWLQRNTTGLWDVNSMGQITVSGHRCLTAVLSDGSTSMSDGVSLVESTARATTPSASAH